MKADQALFEPIDHESVADSVVDQIETLIIKGVLKEGYKLPAEREMAEVLNVSRPKLREALKRLEDKQLITVHHGEGSYIAPLIGKALSPALLDLYARHPVAFYDYLEYRREQEAFAARLAAERATDYDKQKIITLLDELKRSHIERDDEASRNADINFHAAIVDASHNSTLIHMMGSIYELTRRRLFYNRAFLRAIDGTGSKLLEQHLAIGHAILDGQAEQAEQAARDHITFVQKSYRIGKAKEQREITGRKRQALID